MKKYSYACLELKLEFENIKNVIKIPFDNDKEAFEYLVTHFDSSFHSDAWIE